MINVEEAQADALERAEASLRRVVMRMQHVRAATVLGGWCRTVVSVRLQRRVLGLSLRHITEPKRP